MATTVKCRSSTKNDPLYSRCECCGEAVTAFGCGCNGAAGARSSNLNSSGSGGNTTPIIVQAPAAPAPIIIQQARRDSLYPVFIPLVQSVREDKINQTEGNKNQQARGQAMPVYPAEQNGSGSTAVESQLPNAFVDSPVPIETTPLPVTTPGASQTKAPTSSDSQSSRLAPDSTSPSGASGQPIIINITNSQDRDSNNRSSFAARIHDESFNHREWPDNETVQTKPQASVSSETARPRRARIVHVRPLQEKVNTARVVSSVKTEPSKETMYHYVGWS